MSADVCRNAPANNDGESKLTDCPSGDMEDTVAKSSLFGANTAVSADGACLRGEPIQVVIAEADDTGQHHFRLDAEALERILLNERIRDKRVAIVSVAGAFRKGKSFLLDFFLRYLDAADKSSWLGTPEAPLEGFSWRGGSERDTTGILLWSEPYLVRRRRKRSASSLSPVDSEEEEVAVLLMDTQGAFDSLSTVRDCATVFALSTMLSSVQVYNLSSNIQEDDLQHLQLFTEYGRLALEEDSGSCPFQNLEFLVRDWCYPYEAAYGEEGGKKILERRLQISERQHPELQQLRRHIRSCFERIGCFLMPHPGMKVATNPHFDGRVCDIEADFAQNLKVLVPLLLAPENLVVKVINGTEVTAREIVEYFKVYIKIYQGNDLPEPKSMLRATAEANNLAAVASSKDLYIRSMDEVVGGDCPYMAPELLEGEQQRCRRLAMENFRNTRKMGGPEFSEQYAEQLSNEISALYEQYKVNNQSKNLFIGVKTPLVLFVVIMFNYLMSGIFSIVGLDPVAAIFNWVLFAALVGMITWGYVRYTGHSREIGHHIDHVAELLMEKVLQPMYVALTQRAAQQMFTQSVPLSSTTLAAAAAASAAMNSGGGGSSFSAAVPAGSRRTSSLRPAAVHSKRE